MFKTWQDQHPDIMWQLLCEEDKLLFVFVHVKCELMLLMGVVYIGNISYMHLKCINHLWKGQFI